jgi:acyl-CoA thioesterase II
VTDAPEQPSIDELVADTLACLALERDPRGWVARAPEWIGDYVFGGYVIAQALAAASRWAPEGRRVHSMHAYFLRPVRAGQRVLYEGDTLRDGRAFTVARIEASQDGKPVLALTTSFTADTDGYEYDLRIGDGVPPLDESTVEPGPGPWIASYVGPTEPLADGTREATHRMWFRIPAELPDDAQLHTALIGFASDWTGTAGRPLHLDGDVQGMVSLDHAVWFHRPCRADEWLFYDVQALVNTGGRSLLRGVMRDDGGRVVLSMAQEMRLTPVTE